MKAIEEIKSNLLIIEKGEIGEHLFPEILESKNSDFYVTYGEGNKKEVTILKIEDFVEEKENISKFTLLFENENKEEECELIVFKEKKIILMYNLNTLDIEYVYTFVKGDQSENYFNLRNKKELKKFEDKTKINLFRYIKKELSEMYA